MNYALSEFLEEIQIFCLNYINIIWSMGNHLSPLIVSLFILNKILKYLRKFFFSFFINFQLWLWPKTHIHFSFFNWNYHRLCEIFIFHNLFIVTLQKTIPWKYFLILYMWFQRKVGNNSTTWHTVAPFSDFFTDYW